MLKRLLVKPYVFFLKNRNRIRTYIDGKILIKKTRMRPLNEVALSNGLKIILAPHSDDEWVGCSTILQSNKGDVAVIDMDMSGGDTEELHEIRRQEMQSVARAYNYPLLKVEGNKVSWVSDYIKKYSPKYIFVPCYYDWHDEHYEVMDVLKEALEASKIDTNVVMYQVSIPMPPSLINCYHCLDKNEHEEKWRLLDVYYPSQSFLPTFRFKLNERINGKRFRAYAAEVFSVYSSDKWINDYKNNALSLQDREYYKGNLNNIKNLHKKLSAL